MKIPNTIATDNKNTNQFLYKIKSCDVTITLEPELGLYNAYDDINGVRRHIIAIQLNEVVDEAYEPYATLTVNFGEFIGMKNAAYIDTKVLGADILDWMEENGMGKRTDFTKEDTDCSFPISHYYYPLFIFNEKFLKNIDCYGVYAEYEAQYADYEKTENGSWERISQQKGNDFMKKMTHNEYQEFLKTNASRFYNEKDYTMEDYKKDAENVKIIDYDLMKYELPENIKEVINKSFMTNSVDKFGNELFRGRCEIESVYPLIAKPLECKVGYEGGYNGFFYNHENKMLLEYAEGDVTLVICECKEKYIECLQNTIDFYKKDYGTELNMKEFFDTKTNAQNCVDMIKHYSKNNNIPMAYEYWCKLYDLYEPNENMTDEERYNQFAELNSYTRQIDDKTVYAVTDYGRDKAYNEMGYYSNDEEECEEIDEPDICD